MQPKGSQVVWIFEGLGRSSSGDVFEHVQLQLLLGGADVASPGRSKWTMQPCDVRQTDRPRLDDPGMADLPGLSIISGHKGKLYHESFSDNPVTTFAL